MTFTTISFFFYHKQPDFWDDTIKAVKRAYHKTDGKILEKKSSDDVRKRGGSTAVTVILINGESLIVANVGDSRTIISERGDARQLSVDHEPLKEKEEIESRGGFVTHKKGQLYRINLIFSLVLETVIFSSTNSDSMQFDEYLSGNVPRVDGQLAVSRAFGDKMVKQHISSDPDVIIEDINADVEFVILASDGLWKVIDSRTYFVLVSIDKGSKTYHI